MTKEQLQCKCKSLEAETAVLKQENQELRKRLKKYEAAEIIEAFRKSDKSYEELMTFLQP